MQVNWLNVVIACLVFWLAGMVPVMVRDANGQSEDWRTDKIKRCQQWADFAVELYNAHHKEGFAKHSIHVDPQIEGFKEDVLSFQGDEKALRDAVMGDCMGTAT